MNNKNTWFHPEITPAYGVYNILGTELMLVVNKDYLLTIARYLPLHGGSITFAHYRNKEWINDNEEVVKVIAWQPIPKLPERKDGD